MKFQKYLHNFLQYNIDLLHLYNLVFLLFFGEGKLLYDITKIMVHTF